MSSFDHEIKDNLYLCVCLFRLSTLLRLNVSTDQTQGHLLSLHLASLHVTLESPLEERQQQNKDSGKAGWIPAG